MSKRTSSFVRVISYIFIVLLLVAIIGAIVYFTNGFTTDFTTFYVVIDGEDVLASKGGYCISTDIPLEVQVKYTMAFVNEDLSGYSLELRKKSGVRFEYFVDGVSFDYEGKIDLSNCFEITQNDSSFSVVSKAECLKDMLQLVYPDQEIYISDDVLTSLNGDLFSLTIYSYNKESSITIDFSFAIQNVLLDKTEIVF